MTRVLIVEDEPTLGDMLRDALTDDGLAVDVVRDGVDGLWAATEHPYHVILLDIMLPGVSGYEVCRQLRQRRCGRPYSCSPPRTESTTRPTRWIWAPTTT